MRFAQRDTTLRETMIAGGLNRMAMNHDELAIVLDQRLFCPMVLVSQGGGKRLVLVRSLLGTLCSKP